MQDNNEEKTTREWERQYGIEPLKSWLKATGTELLIGYVPNELEDWDYSHPEAGTVIVKKNLAGQWEFFPQENIHNWAKVSRNGKSKLRDFKQLYEEVIKR